MILPIIVVIFSIGIVIFVHEFGHFIVAKKTGVRVEKFYVGMGPEIFGFTIGETKYGVSLLPIGGVVKLAGEEMDDAQPKEGDFFYLPWYKRIYVAAAGSVMNLFLAVFLFALTFYVWGVYTPSHKPVIGEILESYPAAKAGIMKNDLVLEIDGIEIKNWALMAEYIHSKPEKNLKILIERDGKKLWYEVKTVKDSSRGIGLIGISPVMEIRKVGLFQSLRMGASQSAMWNYLTLKYLYAKITKFQKPEISGPVGIIQSMTKAVRTGADNFIALIALISNSLALFNLFPIPLLDGGHIFLFALEGIIKKPIDKKYIEKINTVGLAIIIFIFVFATYSDLTRMGVR